MSKKINKLMEIGFIVMFVHFAELEVQKQSFLYWSSEISYPAIEFLPSEQYIMCRYDGWRT